MRGSKSNEWQMCGCKLKVSFESKSLNQRWASLSDRCAGLDWNRGEICKHESKSKASLKDRCAGLN